MSASAPLSRQYSSWYPASPGWRINRGPCSCRTVWSGDQFSQTHPVVSCRVMCIHGAESFKEEVSLERKRCIFKASLHPERRTSEDIDSLPLSAVALNYPGHTFVSLHNRTQSTDRRCHQAEWLSSICTFVSWSHYPGIIVHNDGFGTRGKGNSCILSFQDSCT